MSSYTFNNNYASAEYSYQDIISGEAEKETAEALMESYEENLAKIENNTVAIFDPTTSIYDPNLPDSTIIELSEFTVKNIIWSIYGDPDYKGFVTIEDLKKLEDLSTIFCVDISDKEGLDWLNYCENLKWLELEFDSLAELETLKQIEGLNINWLKITSSRLYEDAGFDISEEYFSFLKKCPNLNTLVIDSRIVALTDSYFNDVLLEKETEIILDKFGADSQKINFDAIKDRKKISIVPLYNTGIHDIATVFTREQINELVNSGVELTVYTNGWNSGQTTINQDELLSLLNPIYDQIDFILSTINIDESMSQEEKMKKVIEFVINDLTYGEKAAQIQRDDPNAAIPNMFGVQSQELADVVNNQSYLEGYLYGALSENGVPVCGSYAALMQVLLNKINVESYIMTSNYHAYNLVNVDGVYYYVDATMLDMETIDLDEIFKNNNHLMLPALETAKYYQSVQTPANIDYLHVSEDALENIAKEPFKEYKIKFKGQIVTLSLSSLMVLLSVLGLSVVKKQQNFLQDFNYIEEILNDTSLSTEQRAEIYESFVLNYLNNYNASRTMDQQFLRLGGLEPNEFLGVDNQNIKR